MLFVMATFLGGCGVAQPADMATESPTQTVSGTLYKVGESYSFVDSSGKTIDLDARRVDLSKYAGKSVTITGEYSGTTLFVDKIE